MATAAGVSVLECASAGASVEIGACRTIGNAMLVCRARGDLEAAWPTGATTLSGSKANEAYSSRCNEVVEAHSESC